MLVKITDFPDGLADLLRRLTSQATASKAVLVAASAYPTLVDDLAQSDMQIEHLETEILRLRSIIEGARSAAALLLEKTAQGDLMEHGA